MVPAEIVQTLQEMVLENQSNADIARQLYVDPCTVARYRKLMGEPKLREKLYPLIQADAKELSVAKVAKKYGYSRQQIYNIVRAGKENGVM